MRVVLTTVLTVATAAHADTFGFLSAQGQGQLLTTQDPNGAQRSSASLLLQENLGLHYAGLPFGPSVAMVGAGLEASNVNVFGPAGALLSGRAATLDLSVGLLPRRALPLRLYVRGTVSDGGPQSVATLGGRESLAYGANINLEPYWLLPGLRLDAEEHRFTGPGTTTPLGDIRRTLSATLYRSIGAHQLNAIVRVDQEQRTQLGQWFGVNTTLSWASPTHQTTVLGSYLTRSLDFAGGSPGVGVGSRVLPGGARAISERQLRLSHVQRWTPRFSTELTGRLSDARFAGGSGALGGAGLSAGWQPLPNEELSFSAGGDVGVATTTNPVATSSAQTIGATARVGYARPIAFLKPGVFVGANTQYCGGCAGLTNGLLTSLDAGLSLSTLGFQRFDLSGDYRLALVRAPVGRGGNRTEHHARVTARVRVLDRNEVSLLGAYDDGMRDYLDVAEAGIATLHEQAVTGGLGVSVPLWRGTGALDVRHVRGRSAVLASPFTQGPPLTARELTQVNATVLMPLTSSLDVSLGGQGSWTVIDAARPLSTLGVTAGVVVRAGRLSAQLSYQWSRSDTAALVTTQHFLRLSLFRPFEF